MGTGMGIGTGMGTLAVERHGAVVTWRLSNPRKANALDLGMLAQIDTQITQIDADAGVRLLLLRGTPGGVFSAGADIREWAPMSPAQFGSEWIAHGNRIFRRLERLRCPTVAVIEGGCFGGGLELALCCDLRVASTAARFRFPEASIGAIPGWEGGPRLARIAGRGRALEAVLGAREIDVPTALQWGLLNAAWPADRMPSQLAEWLAPFSAVSPCAAALAKAAVLAGDADSEHFHAQAGHDIKASPESAIGIQAFFDKTPAVF